MNEYNIFSKKYAKRLNCEYLVGERFLPPPGLMYETQLVTREEVKSLSNPNIYLKRASIEKLAAYKMIDILKNENADTEEWIQLVINIIASHLSSEDKEILISEINNKIRN